MKNVFREMNESRRLLKKRAKRLLAILMSALMLVGIFPQHISEAADSSSPYSYKSGITPKNGGVIVEDWNKDTKILKLTAVPNPGYRFLYWSEYYIDTESGEELGRLIQQGDPFSKQLSWRVIENQPREVIANFQKNGEYSVWDATSSERGKLEVITPGETFAPGTTVEVKITPNPGYKVAGIEMGVAVQDPIYGYDGVEFETISNTDTATFTMPVGEVWVYGKFYSTKPHTVTLSGDENGTITFEDGSTTKQIVAGEQVKLVVTPKTGYRLGLIEGTTEGYDLDTNTFEMPDQDLNIKGTFVAKKTYEVGISFSPNEDCAELVHGYNDETGIFAVGVVTKDPYQFLGWYDKDTGSLLSENKIYTFVVTRNTDLEARFEKGYRLYIAAGSIQNGSLSTYPDKAYIKKGETVKLYGIPDEGYVVKKYYAGEIVNGGANLEPIEGDSFIMPDHGVAVAVRFVRQYKIAAGVNDAAAGTVGGAGAYEENEPVTLTATPNDGYRFVNWTENGTQVSTNATYTFKADKDRDLVANFQKIEKYAITAQANDPTYGFVSGAGIYEEGDNVTLTATANTDCVFVNWTENGTEVSTNATYTFKADKDRDLVANFQKIEKYAITARANDDTYGSVSGAGTYEEGQTVTLTAKANTNYRFVNWTENGTQVSTNVTYTFIASADRDLVANFEQPEDCKVTAQVNDTTYGSVTGSGTYPYGSTVTLTALPNTDYSFLNWTEKGKEVSTSATYEFTAEEDRDLVANFISKEVCRIYTEQDLRDFAARVNNGETQLSAVLMADISMSGIPWDPIGDNHIRYTGTFDGQGHTISDLNYVLTIINQDYINVYVGLFGYVGSGGMVRNLTVKDFSIEATFPGSRSIDICAGGIVGILNSGTIDNCHVELSQDIQIDGSNSEETDINFGGICGFVSSGGNITRCSVTGNGSLLCSTSRDANIGGIVGDLYSGVVQFCFRDSTGTLEVSAESSLSDIRAGGVAGYNGGKIINCYNVGEVKGYSKNDTCYVGGVTSTLGSLSNLVIKNSYSIGKVSGEGKRLYIGGIVGWSNNYIDGCYYSTDECPSLSAVGATGDNGNGRITNTKGLTTEEFASLMDTSGYAPDVWEQGEIAPVLKEFRCAVTFYANDGTDRQEERIYAYRSLVSQFQNPFTREHYSFIGWNTAADGSGKSYTSEDRFDGDIVLYAQWKGDEYTITFVNEDGAELQSGKVSYGEKPSYSGKTPEKEATAQYSYTFAGWDKTIATVTGDATYTATYTSTVNEYTIKFVNEDGTELQSGKLAYGETPSYNGKTPEKEATAQYTYTFAGWDKTITSVNGDATYTATYTSTVNEYTITFVNENGTELQSGKLAYGETPVYSGETPEKEATAQYTYTFAGWDAEITTVTADATYTATYTSTVNEYTISFVNEDGTELQSGKVAYGETPVYSGETPEKEATAQYTYTFAGWDAEIATVTGDATYTATYTSTVNEYTITFVNEDGTELQSGKVAYGETPVYSGETPEKEATAQYTYTFAGWDAEIATVTKDATYTATYDSTVNEYTITFVNSDGTELQSGKVPYGDLPEYTGEMPMQPDSAQYTLIFAGWDTGIVPVTGEAKYTATFDTTVNEYTITFVNEDGTVLQSGKLAYGETPSYKGETPVKDKTAQYTYTFAGWDREIHSVVGDLTYTATFDAAVNEYKVTFQTNGGSEVAEVTMKYGDTLATVGEPTKPGYDFDGWFNDEACTKAADLTAPITGDTTFYAKWEKVFYTATLNTSGWKEEDGTDFVVTVKRNRLDQKTFDAVKGIYMNGEAVTNALKERGSLILTLKKEYLKTLPEGENELKIEFEDGSVTTKIKVTKKPAEQPEGPAAVKTGDTTPKGLWIALAIALVGMAATLMVGTPLVGTSKKSTKTKIKPRRKVR